MKSSNLIFRSHSTPCYWQLSCDYDEHDLFGTRSDYACIFGFYHKSKCFR
jgi:hypothetical protein